MNEHWYKLDPDKGLPFGKTVIVLRKDGTMVAGARSARDLKDRKPQSHWL